MTWNQLAPRFRSFTSLFLEDRAVRYSLLARFFTIVIGPLTLLSIGTFLRPEEQGVYYVFGSLLQLGAFIDLGFSKSAQQLLAHAFGSLEIQPKKGFEGDAGRLAKFLSTSKAIFQIYALLGLAVFILLGIAGHVYLAKSLGGSMPDPSGPWWSMIASIGLGFAFQSILTVADAANLLALTNKWRLISEICGICLFLGVLLIGGGLWASATLAFVRSVLTTIPVAMRLGLSTWRQILNAPRNEFSYRREVLPLQTQNMVSYCMGFLVFYSYTPLSLSISGPVTAGLVGMSIQIGNIVQTFATVWFNAQIPLMGNLAGSGCRNELLQLHQRGTRITLACWIFVAIGVILAAALGKNMIPSIGERYGSVPEIALFVIGSGGLAWAHVRAAFVRAYRVEPLAFMFATQAIVTVCSLFTLLPIYGSTAAAITYAVTMVLGGIWTEVLVRSFKEGRHKQSFQQNI